MAEKKTETEKAQERFDWFMSVLGGITDKQFEVFLKSIGK